LGAIIRVSEVVEAARALASPRARPAHAAWFQQQAAPLQRIASRHDLRPLFALLPPCGQMPSFLRPLPTGPAGEIDAELAQIGATAEERVRTEVDRCLAARGPIGPEVERSLSSRGVARRLAAVLSALWSELVSPSWRQIRDCLERDILYRSRALAGGGLAAVSDDLSPLVTLDGRRLVVEDDADRVRPLDGAGLLLMPSTFTQPRLTVIRGPHVPTAPITICYPARGTGAMGSGRRATRQRDSHALSAAPGPRSSRRSMSRCIRPRSHSSSAARQGTSPIISQCLRRAAWYAGPAPAYM
jgi:hypothetical protein